MTYITPNSSGGYLLSSLVGAVFGFVMNKARVIEPLIIRDQMVMARFVMLKLFLTASATSALSFAFLSSFKKTRANVLTCINNMGSLMNRGYLPFIIGGLLLGAGLDLAGTCPGMVYVQIGALVQNCWWTMSGCFVGTLLYSLIQPRCHLLRLSSLDIEKLSTTISSHPKTIMDVTGLGYRTLATIFAMLMYLIVFIVETYSPWRREVNAWKDMSLSSYAWSPVLAGIIIGLLQIPLNGLLGKIIGTSMSYVTVLAQVYDKTEELKNNKKNWWQVFFGVGAIAGSYLSSFLYMRSVNVTNAAITGVKPMWGFIGGILLLLGAKTMRACTSGHGLSGMPLMSIASIVSTCCIFAGGITTGIMVNRLL